ncbi:hypothetical protein HY409_02155 [Candidatus Gottesmanbacteria bacterium]|nr:hypothetical protein [Candidatus Gottesmanbacteria bacterium]
MTFFKKYWYLLLIAITTVGLGIVTILTGQKLKTASPVAPSVPQEEPKAVEPACRLTFTLTLPTNTPTPTVTPTGSPTATPTPSATPTATPTATSTPGPTATPTPTPQPGAPSCNSTCSTDNDCPNNLLCSGGRCRNASCVDRSNCTCVTTQITVEPTEAAPLVQATPSPLPTPKVPVAGIGPNVLGASVITIGGLLILLGLVL